MQNIKRNIPRDFAGLAVLKAITNLQIKITVSLQNMIKVLEFRHRQTDFM